MGELRVRGDDVGGDEFEHCGRVTGMFLGAVRMIGMDGVRERERERERLGLCDEVVWLIEGLIRKGGGGYETYR